MVSTKFVGRTLVGVCVTGLLLAIPAPSQAQSSSTFVVAFDRTGDPGTEIVLEPDPLNPGNTIALAVSTGAFMNPCTLENVDVTGSSTISTVQTVDKFGTVKVNVSVRTKGTGSGWVGADYARAVFTGSSYAFDDNQQFSFRLPAVGQEFTSDFSDKLSMRGAKSVDNWTVRAHFRIKVDAAGETQVLLMKTSEDPNCKG